MKINKKTQLWEELDPEEIVEMQRWAEDIILRGKIAHPHPTWLFAWFETFGYDDRQILLLVSTAVPQKVLLSIVREFRQQIKLPL